MTSGSETLSVPSVFNGPIDSANGGYASGVLAELVDGRAEVSLRSPVPLDTPLQADRQRRGEVRVRVRENLIAEVRAASPLQIDIPAPVDSESARRASELYRGTGDGLFSRCFVCGRGRENSFGVFAGEVEGRDLVASPWTPPSWAADEAGNVRSEFLWAVLDCPTYFALYPDSLPMSFLVRMSARLDTPVKAGEQHVVMAWPLERDGRKHHAGSAVISTEGEALAVAQCLLIDTDRG